MKMRHLVSILLPAIAVIGWAVRRLAGRAGASPAIEREVALVRTLGHGASRDARR